MKKWAEIEKEITKHAWYVYRSGEVIGKFEKKLEADQSGATVVERVYSNQDEIYSGEPSQQGYTRKLS